MGVGHDSTEPFIAFEQPVQRLQLTQVVCRKWLPFALPDERSEPLAKASRLSRDVVELPGNRLCPQRFKRFGRDELVFAEELARGGLRRAVVSPG